MPSTCRHCQKREVFLYAIAVVISVSVKYSSERYGITLKYQGNEERNGNEDKDKEEKQRKQRKQRRKRKRKEGGKKKGRSQEKSRKKKRKMCFIPTSFHRTNQGCFLRFRTMDGCGVLPCFSFQEKCGRGHQAGTGAKNTTDAIFFSQDKREERGRITLAPYHTSCYWTLS